MARIPSIPSVRRRLGRAAIKAARRLDPSTAPKNNTCVAAGHFYSPIPSWPELQPRAGTLFGDAPLELPDVDLNPRQQLTYAIEFWASYLYRCQRSALQQVPEVDADGSSIWIRKLT